MAGKIEIKNLDANIQQIVNDYNIDKNKNGIVDYGEELRELLSHGVKIYSNERLVPNAIALGFGGLGVAHLSWTHAAKQGLINGKLGEFLTNSTKNTRLMFIMGGVALTSFILAKIFDPNKDHVILKLEKPYTPSNQDKISNQENQKIEEYNMRNAELESKFETAYKELGIPEGTELKEYTPQRGEYWISILQAKYGTDEATAQKMANKIKEMIYDDPRAAKQTPVMYLPETWTFEGKTYHYNENAQVATTQDYSDDVQTEMGKMSKDLKYE